MQYWQVLHHISWFCIMYKKVSNSKYSIKFEKYFTPVNWSLCDWPLETKLFCLKKLFFLDRFLSTQIPTFDFLVDFFGTSKSAVETWKAFSNRFFKSSLKINSSKKKFLRKIKRSLTVFWKINGFVSSTTVTWSRPSTTSSLRPWSTQTSSFLTAAQAKLDSTWWAPLSYFCQII